MGKVYEDKIAAETLEPLIINPKTVNNYKDNTTLSKDEIAVGNNIILDDGIIEKVPGTTHQNTDVVTGPVMGLHRAYGKTTEKVCIRLADGILQSGPPDFATTLLSGLSETKKTPFINIRGKAYGINETDGLIRYDPKLEEGILAGIYGPNLRKKIAFFESDETWTGGSADTGWFTPEEWTGKSVTSLKLTASASGNTPSSSPLVLDLSVFGNSKASDETDFIAFKTKHSIRNNIDYIRVEFSTGDDTYAVKFQADIYRRDFTNGDYAETSWKVKKGVFIKTGAADWSDVQSVRITAYANALGAVSVWVDFMHLLASPIIGAEMRKTIFQCEDNVNETWAGDSTLTHVEKYSGFRSVRVVGTGARTASLTLGTALDLTKWDTGVSSTDTDEIVFYFRTNDTAAWANANCLTLRMGADSSNYFYYTWTTKALLGAVGNDQWFEVRLKKGDLDALSVGSPNYNNIAYIAFITSTLTGTTKYIYFDEMSLQPSLSDRQIADMESDETWAFTGYGLMSNDARGVTDGVQCAALRCAGRTTQATGTLVLAPVQDCTQFSDGNASTTDDMISFDVHVLYPDQSMESLELWLDNNSLSSFVNAYKFKFDKSNFTPANSSKKNNKYRHFKGTIALEKSQFDRIGTSGGWSTIGAVKFIYNGKRNILGYGEVLIDNLAMKRKGREPGTYYYKYCFMVKDIPSTFSDISEAISNNSNNVLLTNIKTSQDSRVTTRRVYRLGGTFTDTWMLVKSIEDNTTTSIIDDLNDRDLMVALTDEIPSGYLDRAGVKGNNLAYESQSDRLLVWGDPDHKNYVWYSEPGHYFSFSADSFRPFVSEVMVVVPWYKQSIVFYKNRIQKVTGSIFDGETMDIPVNVGACSYWAAKGMKNGIPFVGWDNVYFFDGYNAKNIGDEVKGYFKGREAYVSSVVMGCVKDVFYIGCKGKTGTPTYNNVALRCYVPGSAWTILPNWNVNIFSNWDELDDQNELYYGDSSVGDIYSVNSTSYQFGAIAITSTIESGWLMLPDSEIAIHHIDLKAKGTAASTIAFSGYKDLGASASCTGTITLTADWQNFVLGSKSIHNILRGNCLKVKFVHSTSYAYFKMKDIVIYWEKIPKRITLNEVTIT